MKLNLVSLKLYRLSFGALAELSDSVSSTMTANPNYVSPVPSLIDLGTIITTYKDALTAWGPKGNHGTEQQYRELLDARSALRAALTQLALYAESTTPGDRTALGSVAWPLRKINTPVGILQAVRNLHQVFSAKVAYGTIKIKWSRPLDTVGVVINSYIVMRSSTNDVAQAVKLEIVTKTTFTDLNPGTGVQYYWVIPVGAAGNGMLSDICPAKAMQPIA